MSFTPFRFPVRARAPRKILLLAGPMLAGLGLVAALPAPPAALAQAPAAQAADPRVFSPEQKRAIEEIVKDYLIANPEVFLEVQQSLEAKMEKIQAERIKAAIAQNARDIYHSADAPVAGNPKGDITVVEFFDYNCGYCKRGFPELAKLIDKDPKVRVVLKELPILSKGSEEAARVALAARLQGKYWEVHRALLESKGQASEAVALKIAEKLGLDMAKLKKDMDSPEIKAEIERVRELANKMGINGTPHFLVGDRGIAGAPEDLYEQLAKNVAELRQSGCAVC
jgi:protein-disulfide isomerase